MSAVPAYQPVAGAYPSDHPFHIAVGINSSSQAVSTSSGGLQANSLKVEADIKEGDLVPQDAAVVAVSDDEPWPSPVVTRFETLWDVDRTITHLFCSTLVLSIVAFSFSFRENQNQILSQVTQNANTDSLAYLDQISVQYDIFERGMIVNTFAVNRFQLFHLLETSEEKIYITKCAFLSDRACSLVFGSSLIVFGVFLLNNGYRISGIGTITGGASLALKAVCRISIDRKLIPGEPKRFVNPFLLPYFSSRGNIAHRATRESTYTPPVGCRQYVITIASLVLNLTNQLTDISTFWELQNKRAKDVDIFNENSADPARFASYTQGVQSNYNNLYAMQLCASLLSFGHTIANSPRLPVKVTALALGALGATGGAMVIANSTFVGTGAIVLASGSALAARVAPTIIRSCVTALTSAASSCWRRIWG